MPRVATFSHPAALRQKPLLAVITIAILIGGATFIASAAGTFITLEPEAGLIAGNAAVKADSSASGGSYVEFNAPTPATNFQPSAPYYATFYYPWFKNVTTDGSWNGSTWNDTDAMGTHTPPINWFSNYIPDPDPTTFNPASELYSSNNYATFKWQATKLAEARQEVAIASWWGQGHKTDTSFSTIVTDFMARSDNPYPNLRWAFYYEKEGNIVGGTTDPSVSTIASDLSYFKSKYATNPYVLKVGGKPVVFVYGDPGDGAATAQRWTDANAATGNSFYTVLKVFPGYTTAPSQPSSWHQYAPANRTDSQGPYSYSISPGFWLSGDTVRLGRDLASFQAAASSMVASGATWKLTTTWNEMGEGSGVEPAQEVVQARGSTPATLNPSGAPFGNAYVDALKARLPALEAGTGQ